MKEDGNGVDRYWKKNVQTRRRRAKLWQEEMRHKGEGCDNVRWGFNGRVE